MARAAVFAPGKLFVIGEYAVLYGGRALVAAVNAGIRCIVDDGTADWWLTAPDLGLDLPLEAGLADRASRLLADSVFAGSREFGMAGPLRVVVEGSHRSSRAKRGLGGSAATAVAILGAIAAAAGEDVESSECRRRLFSTALAVHRRSQRGRGSGADVAASVYGGWIEFTAERESFRILPAAIPPGLHLSAVWSGVTVDTAADLERFESIHLANGQPAPLRADVLDGLGSTLDRFWRAASADDRDALLDAVSTYGEHLEAFRSRSTASTECRIDDLVRAARRAGAAAKGSGSVGGDCAVAVTFQPVTLARVEESWERLGAEVLAVGIDPRGVRKEADRA